MIDIGMPEAEWRPFSYAAKSVPELRENAVELINRLDRDFSHKFGERAGLKFELREGDCTLATVDCPVGSGRIKLEWGVLEGQLAAILVVEREVSETVAQCGWQRCLKITLVDPGKGYAGWREKYRLTLGSRPEYLNGNVVFVLGMMIMHALATGPYDPDAK